MNATADVYPTLANLSQVFDSLVGSFDWLKTRLEGRKLAPDRLYASVQDDLPMIDTDVKSAKRSLSARAIEVGGTGDRPARDAWPAVAETLPGRPRRPG